MEIVSRAAWNARAPRSRHIIPIPSPRLWLHHTAGNENGADGVRSIQRFHMDVRKWSDIAYSFLVDRDGTVYEGRGFGVAGGHTANDNSRSHAICAMGNYDVRTPNPGMLRAIADLVRHGQGQGWWGDLTGGHRDAPGASTACPGRHLQAAIPEIRSLAKSTPAAPTPSLPTEDDEMTTYLRFTGNTDSRHDNAVYAVSGVTAVHMTKAALDFTDALLAMGGQKPAQIHSFPAAAAGGFFIVNGPHKRP